MTVSTVEFWNVNHADEQRQNISNKLVEMFYNGKLITPSTKTNKGIRIPAGTMGVYGNVEIDGNVVTANVTYTWSNTEAANEYLSFISNLNPKSASIVS